MHKNILPAKSLAIYISFMERDVFPYGFNVFTFKSFLQS